jgi:hypothetical protein
MRAPALLRDVFPKKVLLEIVTVGPSTAPPPDEPPVTAFPENVLSAIVMAPRARIAPPLLPAELVENVLCVTKTGPVREKIAPPRPFEVFPENVLFVTVAEAAASMAPPSPVPPVTRFPEKTLSVTVTESAVTAPA